MSSVIEKMRLRKRTKGCNFKRGDHRRLYWDFQKKLQEGKGKEHSLNQGNSQREVPKAGMCLTC